jgi:hypothetical protein
VFCFWSVPEFAGRFRMRARQYHVLSIGLVLGAILFMAEFVSRAQTGGGAERSAAPSRPASQTEMTAEREQIWNSPNMLRARAWLADYCKNSAKVTPELAKHYQTELANMTPAQLKLWLLRFDHAEEQLQQRQALWQQAHDASLKQAMAANQATQRAYAAINQEESAAAAQEQQQLNVQAQDRENMAEAKQLETAGPYGGVGYPGWGGIHYHYHLYPYAY